MIQKMIQRLKHKNIMNSILKITLILVCFLSGMTSIQAQGLELNREHNYILSVEAQKPFTTVDALETAPATQKIYNITYADGLGRPMQQTAINGSPNSKDIVTEITYDAYGRQARQYLPYEADGVTGSYRSVDVNTTINPYYLQTYPDDFPGITDPAQVNAYSESVFEASPLNRVTEQGAPGAAWRADRDSDLDHTIKFDWQTNTATEVVYFRVNFTGGDTEKPELVKEGYYPASALYVTITKDENWTPADGNTHTTKEYKDKQGRMVLKRTYASTSSATVQGQALTSQEHDTYYVYDSYGNLTYVIPPKVTTADGVSNTELVELCYQYRYDHKNRLIEKKIPGKGEESIVYNKLDQPILTQDANQRANNQWLFTKYDAFGRVAYTGKITIPNTRRAELQTQANAYSEDLWVTRGSAAIIGGVTMYYNDGGYPKVNTAETLTVNYYDDYTLPNIVSLDPATTTITWEGMTATTKVKGQPTVTQVKVLETQDWITTTSYYDQKGRAWETHIKNEYLGTEDWILNKLDFVGKVEKTKTLHIKNGVIITTIDSFTYDHVGRLLTQTQKIDNQAEERIVENSYDKLGQLIKKNVGGVVTQSGGQGLQEVNYDYNIRGWLRAINEGTTANGDLFGFRINYNTSQHGATALYNGNIAETEWKTANDNVQRWYTYSYDALNRITNGMSYNNRYNLSNVVYDKMGNIMSLTRRGQYNASATNFGDMDILSYTYDSGNKLLSVTDAGNKSFGFKDGTNTDNDFAYDTNGNMISDQNKGITGITYNHLNLPKTVTINNTEHNGNISYIYDATGAKLKKIVTEGSSLTNTTEYAGNYIYKNGVLEFFNQPEGIVEPEADGYKYVYQYKDHLGNIRLSYKDFNKDGAITQDEIVQEKNYYPFGLTHKGYNSDFNGRDHNYGYTSKEEQSELGLEWLDFGARNYDASLGRWMNFDPLSEKYYDTSPYVFSLDNPIFFNDPDGREVDVTALMRKGGKNEMYLLINLMLNLSEMSGKTIGMHTDDNKKSTLTMDCGDSGNCSDSANSFVEHLINSDRTINVSSTNSGTGTGKPQFGMDMISLDAEEIYGVEKALESNNIDKRTANTGMFFLHEALHTKTGADYFTSDKDRKLANNGMGGFPDPEEYLMGTQTGVTVDKMNIFRRELGTPIRYVYGSGGSLFLKINGTKKEVKYTKQAIPESYKNRKPKQ